MASENQTYSSGFKAKVALEALGQHKKNLDKLSDKYGVPVSLILIWTVQLERHADHVFDDTAEPTDVTAEDDTDADKAVDIEVDDAQVSQGLSEGVMHDGLNIKRLVYWSAIAIVLIIIFAKLLQVLYQINTNTNQRRKAAQREYQSSIHKDQSRKELSSFGVVDIEKGVYHMPIDSVINNMAVDNK